MRLWRSNPAPQMTAKRKLEYVMTELGLPEGDKQLAIDTLQDNNWKIAGALDDLRRIRSRDHDDPRR